MGETAAFRSEDRIALPIALALHVGVVAVLLLQPVRDEMIGVPQRMTVNLASEVSLEATAPDPVSESRVAIAPILSEELAPDVEPQPSEAVPEASPPPPPSANRRSSSSPATQPRERSRPDRPQPSPSPAQAANRGGGSRIGSDFLPGGGSSTRTDETRIPASQIGASARASLQQAINRQLKPHWTAPSGLDAERLVTVLAFKLNEDGTLAGPVRVVSQSGVNASNRPQAPLHAERAKRAVQQAAPFDLPPEYYDAWRNITAWRFDRRL